jgi:sugar/nucleoside kinase (ribokinase family)
MAYYDVLGIGYAVCDELLFVPQSYIKKLGVEKGGVAPVSEKKLACAVRAARSPSIISAGGSAANTAKALVPFGARVAFTSIVGTDRASRKFQSAMKKAGVDTYLSRVRGKLDRVAAFITPDKERTFLYAAGVSPQFDARYILENLIRAARIVHIEGYMLRQAALIDTLMKLARKHHAIISFDLGNFELVAEEKRRILQLIKRYVDIIFMNERELFALLGKKPKEGVRELQKMCSAGAILLGKRGALVFTRKEMHLCPAHPICPIDTTGAGDFFIAGFLMGGLANLSLKESAILGNLSAARAISHVGTDIPDRTSRRGRNRSP